MRYVFYRLMGWLLVGGLWLGLAPAGQAQQPPLYAHQSSATYTFGQAVHFSLQAKSEAIIEQVTLFVNAPELPGAYFVGLEFVPGRDIALSYDLSLSQLQFAPFTTIAYWWEVTTSAGNMTLPRQTLAYLDDRFQWRQVAYENFVVHWTGPDDTIGQAALTILDLYQPRLELIIPAGTTPNPIQVFIYPSTADLRSALRLTGRDWVGAHARPELGVLLVTAVNPRTAMFDLGQSLPHELSHLLLYQSMGDSYANRPRWLDEGLATFFEATTDPNYALLLQQAVNNQQTLPFAQLCAAFPTEAEPAILAYAQSVSLIRYIQAEFGNRKLSDLIQAYSNGASCDSGLRQVLGISLETLSGRWLEQQQTISPAGRFWQVNGLWLLLLIGSFLFTALLLKEL